MHKDFILGIFIFMISFKPAKFLWSTSVPTLQKRKTEEKGNLPHRPVWHSDQSDFKEHDLLFI